MKKMPFLLCITLLQLTACSYEGMEVRNNEYVVGFRDSSQKTTAECLLNYLVSEKIVQKKSQIITQKNKDTIRVRLFGKPKGNWKKEADRPTAEFACRLLANDFSKICFQGKVICLQIGQDFSQRKNYIEATSDGSVGYRDYKKLSSE